MSRGLVKAINNKIPKETSDIQLGLLTSTDTPERIPIDHSLQLEMHTSLIFGGCVAYDCFISCV